MSYGVLSCILLWSQSRRCYIQDESLLSCLVSRSDRCKDRSDRWGSGQSGHLSGYSGFKLGFSGLGGPDTPRIRPDNPDLGFRVSSSHDRSDRFCRPVWPVLAEQNRNR